MICNKNLIITLSKIFESFFNKIYKGNNFKNIEYIDIFEDEYWLIAVYFDEYCFNYYFSNLKEINKYEIKIFHYEACGFLSKEKNEEFFKIANNLIKNLTERICG